MQINENDWLKVVLLTDLQYCKHFKDCMRYWILCKATNDGQWMPSEGNRLYDPLGHFNTGI
jgi:hypothetical protein